VIVFIDSSGSTSIEFITGKQYYVLCLVFFDLNDASAESKLQQSVKQFCLTYNITEVRWTSMNKRLRRAFASVLSNQSFKFVTFTINKSTFNLSSTYDLLKVAFSLSLKVAKEKGLLYPDIIADRDFSMSLVHPLKRVLIQLLKQKISLPDVHHFELVDSINYPGVQVADYLAGLYRSIIFKKGNNHVDLWKELYSLVQLKHVGKAGQIVSDI